MVAVVVDTLEHTFLLDDFDVESLRAASEELPAVASTDAGAIALGVILLDFRREELEWSRSEASEKGHAVVELVDLHDRDERGLVCLRPRVAELSVLAVLNGLVLEGEARLLRIPVHYEGVDAGGYRGSEGSIDETRDAKGGKGEV